MNKLLATLALLSALTTGLFAGSYETEATAVAATITDTTDKGVWATANLQLALDIFEEARTVPDYVVTKVERTTAGAILNRDIVYNGADHEAVLRSSAAYIYDAEKLLVHNYYNDQEVTDSAYKTYGTYTLRIWADPNLKQAYGDDLFSDRVGAGLADAGWQSFVMTYAGTQSTAAERIAVLQQVKDVLTFTSPRSDEQNIWYKNVSGSIIGITLD